MRVEIGGMGSGYPSAYQESGLHAIDTVAKTMVDILLNPGCNAKAIQHNKLLNNRTCCNPYRSLTWIQVVMA